MASSNVRRKDATGTGRCGCDTPRAGPAFEKGVVDVVLVRRRGYVRDEREQSRIGRDESRKGHAAVSTRHKLFIFAT